MGARVIHVDPRFTRTLAMADRWVPLRAGTDVVFLGTRIHRPIETGRYFREDVVEYTNAPFLLRDDTAWPDEIGGVFSGWNADEEGYSPAS